MIDLTQSNEKAVLISRLYIAEKFDNLRINNVFPGPPCIAAAVACSEKQLGWGIALRRACSSFWENFRKFRKFPESLWKFSILPKVGREFPDIFLDISYRGNPVHNTYIYIMCVYIFSTLILIFGSFFCNMLTLRVLGEGGGPNGSRGRKIG